MELEELIVKDFTVAQIAEKLHLSVPGAKKRIKKLREKYGAKSKTELAVKLTTLRVIHEVM